MVANRTGESPPSGMTRGALGNMAMVELCTHPAIERAGLETLHLRCVRPSSIPTTTIVQQGLAATCKDARYKGTESRARRVVGRMSP